MSWQPIETAKRGSVCLLAVEAGVQKKTFVASFCTGINEDYWSITVGLWWTRMSDDWTPTHWMPLPPPPEVTP